MPKLIKRTPILDQSEIGVATLKSIDPMLDLGDGVTLENYEKLVLEIRSEIEQYNTAIVTAEQTSLSIKEKQKALNLMGRRIQLGLGFKHGIKSDIYQMFSKALKFARRRLAVNTGATPNPVTSDPK